ncbi:MAG: hypothetical protein CMB46_00915 [Euryarchaeota archaeon]|nr:hypothetical protein [Euryarchaeota archaeon]
MGTCEMCGTERVSTLLSEISGAKLRCCSRCIESNNLLVIERYMPKQTPTSVSTQEPRSRMGIKSPKPEKEIAPDFHLRVRKSRESRGWEQRELAKRINVRLNDIQKIEGGIVPSDSLALKIEKALGIILLVEPEEDHERSVNVPSGRGLTIGDALDEFLSKGE